MGSPVTPSRIVSRLRDEFGVPNPNELAEHWLTVAPSPLRVWQWLDAGVLYPGDCEGQRAPWQIEGYE